MKTEYEQRALQFSDEIPNCPMPKNFGQVNDRLYRGGWPQTADFLSDFNIIEVITLYSSSNEKEAKWIITLKKIVADAGVNHTRV
ncbi:MAG TPA: hypothetical protein PLM16_00725 [Candidatus Woesebacteria bacterium]|nr:hypothetical protein [Candidatus Woesebacteria bacterium]